MFPRREPSFPATGRRSFCDDASVSAVGRPLEVSDRFRGRGATAGCGRYVELYITAIMLSPQLCRVSLAWVDLGRATPRNAEALATRHWT